MRGEVLFEKMTGISDEYVAEAALVPAVGAAPAQKPEGRFAALSRVLNSGWGVACICFMVAIAAVVGMVAWGRMGDPTGPGSDPSVRFAFSYEMKNIDGTTWNGIALPGDSFAVDTTVINHGKTFFYTGSSSEYCAYAQFVLQEDETVTIDGGIFHTTDVGIFSVGAGEEGHGCYEFTIPKDATPGVYDLVLSYKGSQQVYPGVLMVEEAIDNPFPELTDDPPFTFGYELFLSSTVSTGTELILEAWVVNDGEKFKVNGVFLPQATLCYKDEVTTYTVKGELIKEGVSATITYVESGATGRGAYTFDIPEDAPTGSYSLVLSFGGATRSFENVLTVVESTVTDLDYPLPEADHPFSFGYEPFGGFAIPGDWLTVEAWVINEGEPFSFFGDPYSFQPLVMLYHMDSAYVIQGFPAPTGVMPRPCNVLTNQKGSNSYEIRIPVDAPTGEYGLRLSYNGQEQVFENLLTVATP